MAQGNNSQLGRTTSDGVGATIATIAVTAIVIGGAITLSNMDFQSENKGYLELEADMARQVKELEYIQNDLDILGQHWAAGQDTIRLLKSTISKLRLECLRK